MVCFVDIIGTFWHGTKSGLFLFLLETCLKISLQKLLHEKLSNHYLHIHVIHSLHLDRNSKEKRTNTCMIAKARNLHTMDSLQQGFRSKMSFRMTVSMATYQQLNAKRECTKTQINVKGKTKCMLTQIKATCKRGCTTTQINIKRSLCILIFSIERIFKCCLHAVMQIYVLYYILLFIYISI